MKKILEDLNSFLETKIKIEPRYERAKASIEDVKNLKKIIQMILSSKWEESYDGHVPIQVKVINRTTHEPLHYEAQPYIEDKEGEAYLVNFEEKMRIATMNLKIATDEVHRLWQMQESSSRANKALKEGRYCQRHGEFEKIGNCPECKKK